MVVATLDKESNQLINSACLAFNEPVFYVKSVKDLEEFHDVIFCVEKQTISELKDPTIYDLRTFTHPKDACYVFGLNTGFKMSSFIKNFHNEYKLLTIADARVLWSETAISIILYDKYRKEIE